MKYLKSVFYKDERLLMGRIVGVLLLLIILSVVLASTCGSVSISPVITMKILLHQIPFLQDIIPVTWSDVQQNIILGLRLPRVCLGLVVGASLSICGVTMQALVRNQLADPFILGVSNGAAAFATLCMLFGVFSFLGTYAIALSAFLGAALTIVVVYVIARVNGRIHITHLLLSGVAISMMMDGVTNVIKLGAPNALGLHNAEFWMSGSLAGAKWAYLGLPLLILIVCMMILLLNYRGMNILMLGSDVAGTLGVDVKRLQKLLVLVASLMTGVTIAVSGTIGFVGLMVPHFTRLLVGSDHRRVLVVSALLGGLLVVWVDVLARVLFAPEELPVGILTAIIGAPVFIMMLKKNKRGVV